MDVDTSEAVGEPYRDPIDFELPIQIHYTILHELDHAPRGHEISYWKIRILLELVSQVYTLYIPPEWRRLPPLVFKSWVTHLRRRPFERVYLGGTLYDWNYNVLLPAAQRRSCVPLINRVRDMYLEKILPTWNNLLQPEDPIHVGVNRHIPEPCRFPQLTLYWELHLPINSAPGALKKRTLWVPPEWKWASPSALLEWSRELTVKQPPIFGLGGTQYKIRKDTVYPVGQLLSAISYEKKTDNEENAFSSPEDSRKESPVALTATTHSSKVTLRIPEPLNLSLKQPVIPVPPVFGSTPIRFIAKPTRKRLLRSPTPLIPLPPPPAVPTKKGKESRCRCSEVLPRNFIPPTLNYTTNSQPSFFDSANYDPEGYFEIDEIEIETPTRIEDKILEDLRNDVLYLEALTLSYQSTINQYENSTNPSMMETIYNRNETDQEGNQLYPISLVQCSMHTAHYDTLGTPAAQSDRDEADKQIDEVIQSFIETELEDPANKLPSFGTLLKTIMQNE